MSSGATTIQNEALPAQDAPSAVVRAGKEQLGAVDWLRLLGIAGVAYYHAEDVWYPNAAGAEYAFAGLHALTAAATYFACASRSATSDGDILWKRFNRVLVPWLFFGAIFCLKAWHSGKFQPYMLLVGGATHLWFLPFIFVVGCVIAMLARRGLIIQSTTSAIGWGTAAILAMTIEPYVGPLLSETPPTWQIVNALPSALMGVAIYTAGRRGTMAMLASFIGAGVAVWVTIPSALHVRAWPAAAACGAVLFGIARLLPIRSNRASTFIGRTSFGVYLLHMLVLTAVVKVVNTLTHVDPNALATDVGTLMILAQVTLSIVASIVIVAILERTPFRRFVV